MVCLVPGVAPPQAGRGIHCSKMFGSSESKLGLSERCQPVWIQSAGLAGVKMTLNDLYETGSLAKKLSDGVGQGGGGGTNVWLQCLNELMYIART